MPTGHLTVDHDEEDGKLRVVLQHIPLTDLMVTLERDSISHRTGAMIDPNYEGMVVLATQPAVIGRYVIDPTSGDVVESDLAYDVERAWGGILAAADTHTPQARKRQRTMWYAGLGFDPELIPEDWWALYGDATDGLVAPDDLPTEAIPASLSRVDLESMKIAEVFSYDDGAFPSPPTFVPRSGATDPDDGYVVVVVHKDGPKEVQVFDAHHIEAGPLARASAPTFSPSLLLHSCWMPDRVGGRPSTYRIPVWRDIKGAMRSIPEVMRSMMRMGPAMANAARDASSDGD